ncbi:hypothetical protein EDD36DRAFT_497743 [Exophiala viscosa]|uniref:Uncharacterized protein n=1 Tax=Exophiala viscosa TaxID=2486360 RepID=A0AAN6DT51_9EURO|nr:hypothetical protein EDD36DRAFT_497743 [Exophiala viscosa]
MERKYMTLSNHGENEESPRTSLQSEILLSQQLEQELAEEYRPISPLTPTNVLPKRKPIANASRHENSALIPTEPASGGIEVSSENPEHLKNAEKHASRNRTRPVHERIGIYTLVIATISTICLLAALMFLAWMWFGDRSSSTWRHIMLNDFAKQAVTISALVLRTAIACLGGVATAMIASISIEHHGVPLKDVAQVSIARFSNSGPDAFWRSMLFRNTFIEMPFRLLLILVFLTTLGSQFTSTILLSDLGQGTVITPSTTSTNTSGFSYADAEYDAHTVEVENANSPFYTTPNYWTTDPTVFQSFAEYSEAGYTSDGVDDTGLTLRAFLPFADTTARQLVREFQGMATVFDTRIVCTRPQMSRLKMVMVDNDITGYTAVSMTGNLTTNASLPGLAATQPVVSFECPLAAPFLICPPLNPSAGGLLSVLDPMNDAGVELSYTESEFGSVGQHGKLLSRGGFWQAKDVSKNYYWIVDIGNAYLVHNGAAVGGGILNNTGGHYWLSTPSAGAWADIDYQGAAVGAGNPVELDPTCSVDECWKTSFRMSLCYDALSVPVDYDSIQEFNITTSAATPRTEPSLQYNRRNLLFPTDSIRTQLGATASKASLSARGVLNLTSAQDILAGVARQRKAKPNDLKDLFNSTTYSWITPMVFYSLLQPLAMCAGCAGELSNFMQGSTVTSTLFTDTISATNSPALALQAVLTTMLRQAYYSFLPTFDAESNVTASSFQPAQIPVRTRGFWAVLGITVAHFVLCLVALVGFISFTHVSSLKNAWQVRADISESPETAAILRNVGGKTDGQVAESIEKDESLRHRRFRVRAGIDSTD